MDRRLPDLKYLRYWHTRFNKQVWQGELSKPKIVIEPCGPNAVGYCEATTPPTIFIDSELSREDAKRVLLHEMIHQWQYENHQPPGHGPSFQQWRDPCLLLTRLSPW